MVKPSNPRASTRAAANERNPPERPEEKRERWATYSASTEATQLRHGRQTLRHLAELSVEGNHIRRTRDQHGLTPLQVVRCFEARIILSIPDLLTAIGL